MSQKIDCYFIVKIEIFLFDQLKFPFLNLTIKGIKIFGANWWLFFMEKTRECIR